MTPLQRTASRRSAVEAAVRVCICLLIVWTSATSAISVQRRDNYKLCEVRGCNCTAQTAWLIINCTFDSDQNVDVYKNSIPPNTMELNIVGGKLLTIHELSFRELSGFGLLSIDGTKMVVLKEQAFDNIRSESVLDVRVNGCNYLLLEARAFKNMLTSIRCEISRCEEVEIRNGVFGRLQEIKLTHVKGLNLAEGAFLFENQTERGRHGIVTNISFHNVTIPNLPRRAFVSALSSIEITNCHVERISSEAFAANEISAISIANSYVGKLSSGAFSQRTLIKFFLLRNCSVDSLESQAIMAAISNITVEFSSIKQINTGAINCSVTANIIVSNNKLTTLSPHSLVFRDWNTVMMESNIIQHLQAAFLSVPFNDDIVRFSFSGNEIHDVEPHAFDSIPELQHRVVHFRFDDNSFHEDCRCHMDEWMSTLMGGKTDVEAALKSSYCKVNHVIATCFKIQEDLISMANFTTLVCGPEQNISCEPYQGVTKTISNSTFIQEEKDPHKVTYILLIVGLVVLALSGTIIIIIIRGGLWLRNKGYCVRFKYQGDDTQHEDEGAMVEEDTRIDYPELTNELLLELREQLKNPETHDKARDLIEILYERFVIEESYTNNNRQDEEAHLYEELGNMPNRAPQRPALAPTLDTDDFLKVMEEKIKLPLIDADYQPCQPPVVQQQYSEPADAAVHVYSELKNKSEADNTNTLASNGTNRSGKMALRPLPDKPGEAGPSNRSKY